MSAWFLLLNTLALGADTSTLSAEVCAARAPTFIADMFRLGGGAAAQRDSGMDAAASAAALSQSTKNFLDTCPYVRGLKPLCLDTSTIDAVGLLESAAAQGPQSLSAARAATNPMILSCLDEAPLNVLVTAMSNRSRVCDPTAPEPEWAGPCSDADIEAAVNRSIRDPLRRTMASLATAELSYDAHFDGFLALGDAATARAELKEQPRIWKGGEAYTRIGWTPDEPLRGALWVETINGPKGPGFIVHGIVDANGDGCVYELIGGADPNNESLLTYPTEVAGTGKCF